MKFNQVCHVFIWPWDAIFLDIGHHIREHERATEKLYHPYI